MSRKSLGTDGEKRAWGRDLPTKEERQKTLVVGYLKVKIKRPPLLLSIRL